MKRSVLLACGVLILLQLGLSLWRCAPLTTVGAHDAASYYLIARHFARGDGLVDDALWHFVGPLQPVVRPAGEYWPPGWPALLGMAMSLFGTSQSTAILFVAVLSCVLPALAFVLARQAGLSLLSSWLAGLLFCGQSWAAAALVSTDVAAVYMVWSALTLVVAGWCWRSPTRGRSLLVGLLAGLAMLWRGEGFILLLTVWLVKPNRWVLLGGLAGLLVPVLYNLVCFGALSPPARSRVLFFTSYADLYFFLSEPDPARWWAHGPFRSILATAWVHVGCLLHDLPLPLLLFSVVGAWRLRSTLVGRALTLWTVAGWVVPDVLAPLVAVPHRPEKHSAVAMCVLAAAALEPWLCSPRLAIRAAALGLGVLACRWYWGYLPWQTREFRWDEWLQPPPYVRESLRQEEALGLNRRPLVMASEPAQAAACLDVPTVNCPLDSTEAIYAAIRHYRPRYLLIEAGSALDMFRAQSGLKDLPAEPVLVAGNALWVRLNW